MLNRIKCKKCGDILELIEGLGDVLFCKCNEIAVHCHKKQIMCSNPNGFEKVDDAGNPIMPHTDTTEPSRADLLKELDSMISNFSELPQHAMLTPITHYDFASALILLSEILRLDKSA